MCHVVCFYVMWVAKDEQVRVAPPFLIRLARGIAFTSEFGRFDVTHLRDELISFVDQRRSASRGGAPIA